MPLQIRREKKSNWNRNSSSSWSKRRRRRSNIAKSKYTRNIEQTLITIIVMASLVQKSNNFGVAANNNSDNGRIVIWKLDCKNPYCNSFTLGIYEYLQHPWILANNLRNNRVASLMCFRFHCFNFTQKFHHYFYSLLERFSFVDFLCPMLS